MLKTRVCSFAGFGFLLLAALGCSGCGSGGGQGGGSGTGGNGGESATIIRIEGSDTMVNLAQAWAEKYHALHPEISVQVSGGGSGVGIASLAEGVTDIANSSRKMDAKEMALVEQNNGKKPTEIMVGLDALAIYVHLKNPIEAISMEDLAEIYGDGGAITKWEQLGVKNVECKSDEITRVSRQSSSGTYAYFREAVLGKNRDYKLGSIDQSGSKDVVALVAGTPCAIGYSGMGYRSDDTKMLKVSKTKGGEAIAPSVESAGDGSYPIARPLLMYTLGEPAGHVKEFLDWIASEEGQKIVLDVGYVPISATKPAADGVEAATPAVSP